MTRKTRAQRRARANEAVAQVLDKPTTNGLLLKAFEPGVWYLADVKNVDPHLGHGFYKNQKVPFRVREYAGEVSIVVFNMNHAIRQLNPEQARQALRSRRMRVGTNRVVLMKAPDQTTVEEKYQWEISA